MRKNCAFILILLCIVCLIFCSCGSEKLIWGSKNTQNVDGNSAKNTFVVYICGAVEREGYYEIEEGTTYIDAILKAGCLDCSYLTDNANSLVDGTQSVIFVCYVENGAARACYDVNSEYFRLRLPRDGLSDAVVNKIADYLNEHGKIANKSVLAEILGKADYANYHYKLYIAEADYEKVD